MTRRELVETDPPVRVVEAAVAVLRYLCAHSLDDLSDRFPQSRLSAQDIAVVLSRYGARLSPPPADAGSYVSVISVQGSTFPTWSVVTPVWTEEEGRSDLSLELTISETPQSRLAVELDDLHVL